MLTKFVYAGVDDTYAEEVMTVLAARLPTDSDLDWERMAANAARGACKFVLTDDGVGLCEGIIVERLEALLETGQEKGAKFPTSKAPISVVFHSFWLIFGRVIIFRNNLEA